MAILKILHEVSMVVRSPNVPSRGLGATGHEACHHVRQFLVFVVLYRQNHLDIRDEQINIVQFCTSAGCT